MHDIIMLMFLILCLTCSLHERTSGDDVHRNVSFDSILLHDLVWNGMFSDSG